MISANIKNTVIKYDFLRILKHFLGFQKSLDKYNINLPIYIDQNFLNNKRYLNLNINMSEKLIKQTSLEKFGESIHYCNLYINEESISDYLNNLSKNIFGVSTPFINQNRPGPISNDLIKNIWENY